jgi:tetratricopeptide (TPR) repeat protein
MRSAAGALAMRQGDVKAARTELQALLADPDERGWKFALAALIGGGRDPAVPAQVLGELVDANAIPPKIEAWQEFGRLALRMDKPELARRMIDEVVKRFPEEPRVALLRASQLQQAGETDKALSLLHDVEPKTRQDPSCAMRWPSPTTASASRLRPSACWRSARRTCRPGACAPRCWPSRATRRRCPTCTTNCRGRRPSRTRRSACCWARSPST